MMMAENRGPVVVTLSCEANPSQESVEIDRDEWEAMTPAQRLRECDEMLTDHVTNAGGSGWWIDDPDDAWMVGEPTAVRDPLRELAEWLVSLDDPVNPPDLSFRLSAAAIEALAARAREALGGER
jgi:hypothetical protein